MLLKGCDFIIYCNDVPFGRQEIKQIDPSENQEIEVEGFLFPEPVCIKNGFDYDAYVASLPIQKRYLLHCFFKGWMPSTRGLCCFIRLLRLGYYKTL